MILRVMTKAAIHTMNAMHFRSGCSIQSILKPTMGNQHGMFNPLFFSQPQRSRHNATLPSSVYDKVTQNLDSILKQLDSITIIKPGVKIEDQKYKQTVLEFPWLPGYLIKARPERVEGGHLLEKYVRENNLYLLRIPQQYRYQVPKTHLQSTTTNAFCIAKKIEGTQGGIINPEQANQLVQLMIATGIGDLPQKNLVHCHDGTIAIIDTERFSGVERGLKSLLNGNLFHPEAKQQIQQAIDSLDPNLAHVSIASPIPIPFD